MFLYKCNVTPDEIQSAEFEISNLFSIIPIIISLISLFVAIRALNNSIETTKAQIRHNELSVMPICEMYLSNFNDYFSVELINKGMGVMQIQNIQFINPQGERYKYLIDFISDKSDMSYNNIEEKIIMTAGERIELIKITKNVVERREKLIDELSGIKVRIVYNDVYENTYNFEYCIDFSSVNYRV